MHEEWKMESTEKYLCKYKEYSKDHLRELAAMIDNLKTYFNSLSNGVNPLQMNDGFIHNERQGIYAIDQKGGGQKMKLQQTRLYIYPDVSSKKLFLLTIGDKHSQNKQDIPFCKEFVKDLRSQVQN